MNVTAVVIVCLLVVLSANGARGVEPGASAPDAEPGAPVPSDPLAGPRVREGGTARPDGAPTLIDRTFEGTLRRYETRLEEAAAERLNLSTVEREAVDAIFAERAAMMDAIVRENIELLLRGVAARESGDRKGSRENLLEMREKFGGLAERGGLLEELAGALPSARAEELRTMVQEYWGALLEEETAKQRRGRVKFMEDGPGDDANKPGGGGGGDAGDHAAPEMDSMPGERGRGSIAGNRQVLTRLALEEFGREIKRSYDRIAQDGQKRLDEVVKQLALTPEQEARVRQIVLQHAQEAKLNPNLKQKTRLFFDVARELTPEQRREFMRLIRTER